MGLKVTQMPVQDEAHDKVLESRMAELIGTTTKALQRKRERGVMPPGVWQRVDGRVMYSIRRYEAWVESLWEPSPRASKSSGSQSASDSHGNPGAAKRSPSRRPRPVSQPPQLYVLK